MTIGPISQERRFAACKELSALIKVLNESAASLAQKVAALGSADPKDHNKAVSNLRRYRTYGRACGDAVEAIEARLLGMEPKELHESERQRRDRKLAEHKRYLEGQFLKVDYNERELILRLRDLGPGYHCQLFDIIKELPAAADGGPRAQARLPAKQRGGFTVIDGGAS